MRGSQELEIPVSNLADVIKVGIGISAPAKRLLCLATNKLTILATYARRRNLLGHAETTVSLDNATRPVAI